MMQASRILAILVLTLLAANGALANSSVELTALSPLQLALALLPELPDLPVGALLFGTVAAWFLMRRRPQRRRMSAVDVHHEAAADAPRQDIGASLHGV